MDVRLMQVIVGLPAELRWKIFTEAVGRQVIHIKNCWNSIDILNLFRVLYRRFPSDIDYAYACCRIAKMETVSTVNSPNLKRLLEVAQGDTGMSNDLQLLWTQPFPENNNHILFRFSTDCLRMDSTDALAAFCGGMRFTDEIDRELSLRQRIDRQLNLCLLPAANRPFHLKLERLAIGTLDSMDHGYIATFTCLEALYFLIDPPPPIQQRGYPQMSPEARMRAHRKDFENHCIEWWKWMENRLQIPVSIPQFLWPGMYNANFDIVDTTGDTAEEESMDVEEIANLPAMDRSNGQIVGDQFKLVEWPVYEIANRAVSLSDYIRDGHELPETAGYGIGSDSYVPGFIGPEPNPAALSW